LKSRIEDPIFVPWIEAGRKTMATSETIRFRVEGMTCGGCAAAVTKVVQRQDPGAEVAIDLAKGMVDVRSAADAATLAAAITKAGYPAARA
jgi:copper chaperone